MMHNTKDGFIRGPDKGNSSKLLLFTRFDPNSPQSISAQISTLMKRSAFHIDSMNLYFSLSRLLFRHPNFIDLSKYSGVILHNTLCYDRKLLWRFVEWPAFRRSGLPLVVMRQDENIQVNDFIRFLSELDVKLLLTTVGEKEADTVYPRQKLPNLAFMHTLTGYFSDELRRVSTPPFKDRNMDVSYRAAINPPWFGKLTLDKVSIGVEMEKICRRLGLKTDISSRYEDRINGESWFHFLGSSRIVLGTESGASVFDFDGSLEETCKAYMKRNPGISPHQVWEQFVRAHENNVRYGQLGPRHLEAIALGCGQILLEGNYSGILIPDRHYIPLRPDYSNADEALEKATTPSIIGRLIACAREEIGMNDALHYRSFVAAFDDNISRYII